MQKSLDQLRPFAVITGAESGIGYELAREFAEKGYDLLIASHSEAILDAQDDLEVYGTDVECIEVNLATFKGVEIFTDTVHSYRRPVDILVINAAAIEGGMFLDVDLREEINLINHNIISVVHLTKNLIGDMYDNGMGKVMYVADANSPDEIVNTASKAFISSFADSIRHEAKEHGVTITVLNQNSFKTILQDWASKVLPERFKSSYSRKISEPHA